MVKVLLGCGLISACLFSSCGGMQSANSLYLNYCKKEVPRCFENFQGMGKEVFPDFLSWGVFRYKSSLECLKKVYLEDTATLIIDTLEDGTIIQDERFSISNCYPGELNFYKDAIEKGFIKEKYECNDKIYIWGVKYPYGHEIIFDTVTHNVLHLVSAFRE